MRWVKVIAQPAAIKIVDVIDDLRKSGAGVPQHTNVNPKLLNGRQVSPGSI